MIKVAVTGAMGKMGREVLRAVVRDEKTAVAGAVDPAAEVEASVDVEGTRIEVEERLEALNPGDVDVLVDFTVAESAVSNIEWALNNGIDCVVGTTGIGVEEMTRIDSLTRETGSNVIMAPNFAIGAVLMMKFAGIAAELFDQCEIVELHHRGKADAPSGTAIRTAEIVEKAMSGGKIDEPPGPRGNAARGLMEGPVAVHSVRLDGLVAHQEVIFGAQGQTLRIRHDTIDRSCFMPGVLAAVKAVGELPGLTVGLERVLGIE